MITVDLNRLNMAGDMKILDVGCGTGRHSCALTRPAKNLVVASDIDFDAVKETRRRLAWEKGVIEQRGQWEVIVSDVRQLPFRDESFDLIICSELMEHVIDEKSAVKELVRVLRTGCDLVVSVPRYFPEKICWLLSNEYNASSGGHVRIYKKQDLVKIFEQRGLRKWSMHFAHALHTPYWWLKCLLGVNREDSLPINLYHRFLVWDMMRSPLVTRMLDRILNPLIGKSVVIYFRKPGNA